VTADGVTRQPIEAESAIYFTCAEAVQNAVKHAAGATGVWITLTQTDDTMRFEIQDDGPGFTSAAPTGRGLRNMHDRIEAIHGTLTVAAAPGGGTGVLGGAPPNS
jgi:signal transduction histidine kinase